MYIHRAFFAIYVDKDAKWTLEIVLSPMLTVQKTFSFSNTTWKPIYSNSVLLCCTKRLCIFWPKGAIQIRYCYYYYYYYEETVSRLEKGACLSYWQCDSQTIRKRWWKGWSDQLNRNCCTIYCSTRVILAAAISSLNQLYFGWIAGTYNSHHFTAAKCRLKKHGVILCVHARCIATNLIVFCVCIQMI